MLQVIITEERTGLASVVIGKCGHCVDSYVQNVTDNI